LLNLILTLAAARLEKIKAALNSRFDCKWKRQSAALSIIWMAIGGGWSFYRNSESWREDRALTAGICNLGSASDCAYAHNLSYGEIDLVQIIIDVSVGLVLIWCVMYVMNWANADK